MNQSTYRAFRIMNLSPLLYFSENSFL